MKKLRISKSLNMCSRSRALASDFILFCAKKLPIDGNYLIQLVDDRQSFDIQTTAVYFIGNNKVVIYCKNRALVDILRSIAHEMVHMMQDEQGMIDGPVQDAGGFHEDQANAKAGELIKLYAKSSPSRKKIYESIKRSGKVL